MAFFYTPKYTYQRKMKFTLSEQQTAIDDLYFTENLQNQSLIDLHESLVQVETEIANVDAGLNALESNFNGEYHKDSFFKNVVKVYRSQTIQNRLLCAEKVKVFKI